MTEALWTGGVQRVVIPEDFDVHWRAEEMTPTSVVMQLCAEYGDLPLMIEDHRAATLEAFVARVRAADILEYSAQFMKVLAHPALATLALENNSSEIWARLYNIEEPGLSVLELGLAYIEDVIEAESKSQFLLKVPRGTYHASYARVSGS